MNGFLADSTAAQYKPLRDSTLRNPFHGPGNDNNDEKQGQVTDLRWGPFFSDFGVVYFDNTSKTREVGIFCIY